MFPESACGGRREENEKIFPLGEIGYFGWVAAGWLDGLRSGDIRGRTGGEDCGMDGVKSVIIKDIDGRILFHIKDTKSGADAKVAGDISPYVSILVIANDRSRIRLNEATAKRGNK